MLESELNQLDERVQRLIAAYRQERFEKKRVLQERDRLLALNAELKRRIEGVVERIRSLEADPNP
jgi:cell division protein ZapB